MPALSYLFTTESEPFFSVRDTPTNLGAVPETLRRRSGAIRSLHPTHSVVALGPLAQDITRDHGLDRTPVGLFSPFSKVKDLNGQVMFLGCGLRCNTSIHGVEELLPTPPPYLFQASTIAYTVQDAGGHTAVTEHRRHNFAGVGQRYERLVAEMPPTAYSQGQVMQAHVHVLDARAMWNTAFTMLQTDVRSLKAEATEGEDQFLVPSTSSGYAKYRVGPRAQ
jgi:aminoglycoside 3-N-acetyltransferase